ARREQTLEVVREELGELLAGGLPDAEAGHAYSSASACRSLLRARCSSTRWLPSDNPSRSHTSSALKPSTSRSVTTRRCVSGSSAIAACTCPASSAESASCSALRLHGRIGESQ